MFLDITPGTPAIYREEVFKKLFLGGYDVEHNVIFGVDCTANDYNTQYAKSWMDIDNKIYNDLGLNTDDFKSSIYKDNLLRFLGKSIKNYERKIPLMGE